MLEYKVLQIVRRGSKRPITPARVTHILFPSVRGRVFAEKQGMVVESFCELEKRGLITRTVMPFLKTSVWTSKKVDMVL